MKKLAIIGSSNSMLSHGYGTILKKLLGNDVDIFSVGATGSIKSIFFILDFVDIDNYEYIVFDNSMNDTASIYFNTMNEETIISYIVFIALHFNNRHAIPLFLILPTLWINTIESSSYLIESIAKIFNIKTINIEDKFIDVNNSELLPENDKNHFIEYYQEKIANLIIKNLKPSQKTYHDCYEDLSFTSLNIDYIKKYGEEIQKRTSAMEFEVCRLDTNIKIYIPKEKFVCGIFYYNDKKSPYVCYKNLLFSFAKNINLPWNGFYARSIGYSFQNFRQGGEIFFSSQVEQYIFEDTYIQYNNIENKSDEIYINSILLSNIHPYIFGKKFKNKYISIFMEQKNLLLKKSYKRYLLNNDIQGFS